MSRRHELGPGGVAGRLAALLLEGDRLVDLRLADDLGEAEREQPAGEAGEHARRSAGSAACRRRLVAGEAEEVPAVVHPLVHELPGTIDAAPSSTPTK